MHEYSIVEALIARVQAEAESRHAKCVHRVAVSIGDVSGVDVALLETAYTVFRDRTICAAAALEIRAVPPQWRCPRCGAEIARGALPRCGRCDAPATLVQGDEIVLDRIEMEVL